MINSMCRLLRIKSWFKNILVFIPLVYGGVFIREEVINVLIAFCSFSLVSSAVYIINDIKDIEKDKLHPQKCTRPIASGEIALEKGALLASVLFLCGLAITAGLIWKDHLTIKPAAELLLYIGINLGYSMGLKDYPLVDVFMIAAGFMIRVFYGAAILGMDVSSWVTLTVFAGSLYLGFGKRLNELKHYGTISRKGLEFYTVDFLERSVQLFMGLCLVFYSLACASYNTVAASRGVDLVWTIPLVTMICLKYNLNLSKMEEGDPVTIILGDRCLVMLVLFYALSVITVLYLT